MCIYAVDVGLRVRSFGMSSYIRGLLGLCHSCVHHYWGVPRTPVALPFDLDAGQRYENTLQGREGGKRDGVSRDEA
jgi:hypothetical protein